MASDLTLSTPLGQAKDPGAPPSPEAQNKPDIKADIPGDLASWYRTSMQEILPRFEAATKAAQDSIAKRQSELAELKGRTLASPGLPEPPETPQAPAAPKITSRPFLAGGPGDDAITSLNKAMAGLGLIAQMGVGIKGGNPTGALAAYTGALQGWKAGDLRRGAQEWQNYMGELHTYDRDVRNIREKYEDIIRKYGADQDRLKMEAGLLFAEHGLAREASEMGFKDPMMAYEMLKTTGQRLEALQRDAATVARDNLHFLSDREIRLRGLENQQNQLAETARHHRALEENQQTKVDKVSGPVAERIGALQEAMTSRDQINALRDNPKIKAELDAWIGPVASRQRWGAMIPGGAFQPPDNVVKLDQALANMRNTALKARSGAAVTEPEQRRFDMEFPKVSDPPDVFWRKYAAIERNVKQNADTFRQTAAPNAPESVVRPVNPQSQEPAPSRGWGKAQLVNP